MKKFLLSFLLAVSCIGAFAGADDIVFTRRNSVDSGQNPFTPPHNTTGVAAPLYDSASPTTSPQWVVLGAGLTVGSGVVTVDPQAWSAITGKPTTLSGFGITDAYPLTGNPSGFITAAALTPYLTSATAASTYATQSALASGLAGKFNTPTGTTAQYLRGDGSLGTLPSAPVRSFAYPTRPLNSCFQISATRDARVSYSVDITVSVTLGGTPRGSAYLRTYTDSACSAGQQTIVSGSSGMPATLGVVVGLQNLGTISLPATVPAGVWARIETANDSGTPVFAARQGQEVLE